MKRVVALSIIILGCQVATGEEFHVLCDFDRTPRYWSTEIGFDPTVRVTHQEAHSGRSSLAVDLIRQHNILRATWGMDTPDVEFTPRTRFRFFILGSEGMLPESGQPHGGLLLVEAGGGRDGRHSHWMLDIPGHVYGKREWEEFVTVPISEAHNPGWAVDANGLIDLDRIEKILFVLQREDPLFRVPALTFYVDDVSATAWELRETKVTMAENESVASHVRPVQRGFVGRKRDPGQTVTFSDVAGWRVVTFGRNEATFVRSEEEPLFGEPVGKLTYRGAGGPGLVRLEPPDPIRLERFNGILMWVFGNNWQWVPDPDTPQVLISLEVTDPSGEKHLVQLDRVNWKFWSMMHKCVQEDIRQDNRHAAAGGDNDGILAFPAALTAIEVQGGSNREFRSIYFDSIVFRDERPRLPEFHADLRNLPFPTTPDTILPSLLEPVKNTVTRDGNVFRLTAEGPNGTLAYVYTPATGTLSDLRVECGELAFVPCDGAGPSVGEMPVKAELVDASLAEDQVIRTHWRAPPNIEYDLALSIKGKSIICDWSSTGTRITDFSLGQGSGFGEFQLINVPYLTMGFGTLPAVLETGGIFSFTLLDWHNTNASQFYGRTETISDSEAAYNGGSRYLSLTDGSRNPLRERQFLTVSRKFEEVLPNIPNPPSPFGAVTGRYLYCHVGGTALDRFERWLDTWKLYKEYGIDFVRLSHHEDAWSDGDTVGQGPQEFTMTLSAAPEIGDATLIEYCREVRKLGWLIGLYSNYTDYSMLGESWDERNVTKLPNGEWKRVWPPTFNIKPLKAVEMEAYYAPRIAEKFGTNTVYCDVHTAVTPWENVDYEAGTPGAGMLTTAFRAYGALLLNERTAYKGQVFSEGGHHWFYAGLDDGNYAQMGLPDREDQPLLLDFDLRKIHPLQANVSMLPAPSWKPGLDHLLATQIAYGHIGFLPVSDVATTARVYYLMQQIQSRYTQVPVDRILYRSADGEMLEVSEALPVGAHRGNQVSIRYENGLQIHVNRNPKQNWTVKAAGRDFVLTPSSWVAVAADFLEYSLEVGGLRVSFCDSPVYTYAEAGKPPFDFGAVQAAGSLVIRKDDPRGLKVIPIAGCDSAVLRDIEAKTIRAFSGDGRELGPAEHQLTEEGVVIHFDPAVRYYIIEREEGE